MEYCAGGDLQTLINNRNGVYFPEKIILDWFIQLGLAVIFIHERHIIHRDIKTQNVFLTQNNHIKLGDFGIAKILDNTLDLANTCIGTPYYLSPEMIENKPYNTKSDIWSVGCVLYEMLSLKHAFNASNMKSLILKIVQCSYKSPPCHYSKGLRDTIKQIFQKDPNKRPSMDTLLSNSYLAKRVPYFLLTSDIPSLKLSPVRPKRNLNSFTSTKISTLRTRIGITSPSSKYSIPLTCRKTSPIFLPFNKSKQKLNPHLYHQPNYVPKNRTNIYSGKTSQNIQTKTLQKINEKVISKKGSKSKNLKTHCMNLNLSYQKECFTQNASQFILVSSKNLDNPLYSRKPTTFYKHLNKISYNTNSSSNLSNKVDSSKLKPYSKPCIKMLEKKVHSTRLAKICANLKSLINEDLIHTQQNAKKYREIGYASKINTFDRRENDKSFYSIDFLTSTKHNQIDRADIYHQNSPQNSKCLFVENFPYFDYLESQIKFSDIRKNPYNCPVRFFSQQSSLEESKIKKFTQNSFNLVRKSTGRKHWNCEPHNSLIEILNSAQLTQEYFDSNNMSITCEFFQGYSPLLSLKKIQNKDRSEFLFDKNVSEKITYPKPENKFLGIYEDNLASSSSIHLNNTLTIVNSNTTRKGLIIYHNLSPEQRDNTSKNLNTNNISEMKCKSRLSKILKKVLEQRNLNAKVSSKYTSSEFENKMAVDNYSVKKLKDTNENSETLSSNYIIDTIKYSYQPVSSKTYNVTNYCTQFFNSKIVGGFKNRRTTNKMNLQLFTEYIFPYLLNTVSNDSSLLISRHNISSDAEKKIIDNKLIVENLSNQIKRYIMSMFFEILPEKSDTFTQNFLNITTFPINSEIKKNFVCKLRYPLMKMPFSILFLERQEIKQIDLIERSAFSSMILLLSCLKKITKNVIPESNDNVHEILFTQSEILKDESILDSIYNFNLLKDKINQTESKSNLDKIQNFIKRYLKLNRGKENFKVF